ncbi:antiviral reverse transcriptase Drt3a [Microbacterium sp.]|uniref:antiviral reverse transcriptase Drt3a n=1 Tax=Microbacterium sp. TaxID=51671 RepID=UPI0026249385|nr:antiviral reverse transcriptase Drt3a [Microbacterium sp.]MCV0334426.1 hypothetical protein [Microbacterium sp.]MCV0376389.1 hypothetical protein [Microbacterium sp.]MCV0389948.1 hypothetical protein [Microbacterium sp.]MCV0419483.1 hypothetical protein [Microbacterium sp.]MCV0421788.1 hypothetical protein [Microbacterium sp.]
MKNVDATFSVANYRHIWDEHVRRGRPLAARMPEVVSLAAEMQRIRNEHKTLLGATSPDDRPAVRAKHQREMDQLVVRRRDVLSTKLEGFALDAALRIRDRRFSLGLMALPPIDQKVVYRLQDLDTLSSYFLVKQLERNIRDAFDVTMPDRHRMVSQIVSLLRNKAPKTVLRLDIASCYESISHSALRDMLRDQPRLGQTTQHFLEQFIEDYAALTGSVSGLPRGVGISSFLAEAFLKTIDNEIRLIPGVTFYARYVDDIVILVTDVNHDAVAVQVRAALSDALRKKGLSRNRRKERILSSSDSIERRVTLLGYEVTTCLPTGSAELDISKTRYADYIARLDSAFARYEVAPGPGAATALEKRVQLLTSNQRLWRPGGFNSNGIRFSHRAMREPGVRIAKLDERLRYLTRTKCSDPELRERLSRHGFMDGFTSTRFMRVNLRRREQITSIWRGQ